MTHTRQDPGRRDVKTQVGHAHKIMPLKSLPIRHHRDMSEERPQTLEAAAMLA